MAIQVLTPQMSVGIPIPGSEIPPISDTGVTTFDRQAYFFELDGRVRNIEQRLKETWVELSALCIKVQDEELWREGGYASYGQWVTNACPFSRSYCYAAVGARRELADVPEEDLKEIPLGNAVVLQRTPKNRRKPALIEKAKSQVPQKFQQTVEDTVPEAHIEAITVHRFRLTRGASKQLRAGLDAWRILNDDPDAPSEAALEGLIADYMLAHQELLELKLAARGRA